MSNPGVNEKYLISDALWALIVPLLPPLRDKIKPGRPRMDDRRVLDAIFYLLSTGCQWKALPRSLGAPSTVHDRFQEWQREGFFTRLWQAGLTEYDNALGIEWEWLAIDGAITKAPLGGEATGPSPVDRSKSGTKRSLLTEGNGQPLALVVEGANCHDMKLIEPTLEAIVIHRPIPTEVNRQNLSADKGYDYDEVREILADWGYTAHISVRGENPADRKVIPGYRSRRWVVERTHSWMNRFRRLLIRWEKKVPNYLAMLHFACGWICFRSAGTFQT